ncbi:unnamed protein product [Caenorhabditis brenneri]
MLHRKRTNAMKRRIAVLDEEAARSVAALAESCEELEEVRGDVSCLRREIALGAAIEGVLAENSLAQSRSPIGLFSCT